MIVQGNGTLVTSYTFDWKTQKKYVGFVADKDLKDNGRLYIEGDKYNALQVFFALTENENYSHFCCCHLMFFQA